MPNFETIRKQERFLRFIERGLSTKMAAIHSNIDPSLPYKWSKTDPKFKQVWEDARLARDKLDRIIGLAYELAEGGNVVMIKYVIDRFGEAPAHRSGASDDGPPSDHKLGVSEITITPTERSTEESESDGSVPDFFSLELLENSS